MSDKKRVVVVGAGPGGLTAAMILAHRGYDVEVFEKNPYAGGRSGALHLDGFTFEIGPTFLMMPWILENAFRQAGRDLSDYLDLRPIDPLYRLVFGDGREFSPSSDHARTRAQIDELFPGEGPGFERLMAYERRKFSRLGPCLQVPYSRFFDYGRPRLLKALPYLDAHRSLYSHLGRFFKDDALKTSFTFQAKYLGMSPWDCPATFSIISYVEHAGGIFHPIGGLNKICQAMARVVEEEGGRVHLSTPVERVLVENGRAVGVVLEDREERADHVVVNADFGHSVTNLFPRETLKKWTPERLEKADLSCSIYMMYLGVDKVYDIPHHNVFFADDYKKNVDEISHGNTLSEDFSFYVQNACVTDPGLAPEGKSTIYVLVPVPNNRSAIDWAEAEGPIRARVLEALEKRAGLEDISSHIEQEATNTPADWEMRQAVYKGAVFNLAHTVGQMLYMRPHNQFEDIPSLYLTGGGTHPGSGLPTIYESGIIASDIISAGDGLEVSPPPEVTITAPLMEKERRSDEKGTAEGSA